MKVIFLDHFGVICLADKHGRVKNQNDLPRFDEMRVHGQFDNFAPGAVDVLNSILETGVEIVVSSDWKRWTTLEEIGDFYVSQGIIKEPIDITPTNNSAVSIQKQRELEILEYLTTHKEITSWVAIDDMYLSGLTNFVWVSRTDEGITQEGVIDKIFNFLTPYNKE